MSSHGNLPRRVEAGVGHRQEGQEGGAQLFTGLLLYTVTMHSFKHIIDLSFQLLPGFSILLPISVLSVSGGKGFLGVCVCTH